jgi:hypothetical protein
LCIDFFSDSLDAFNHSGFVLVQVLCQDQSLISLSLIEGLDVSLEEVPFDLDEIEGVVAGLSKPAFAQDNTAALREGFAAARGGAS